MSSHGFQLIYLVLRGRGLRDAEVRFGPGLNVISGPSDTGKTFIAECIDFVLGAKQRPTDIPEAKGYESVILGVRARRGSTEYSLERSLSGGPARLSVGSEPERILGEKHQAGNTDTISHFFLSLSGLADRLIRWKASGATRPASFRELIRLFLIREEEVLKKGSPVRSGQHVSKTAEDSLFRLLLTGKDDSSIVQQPDKAVAKAENAGKAEILEILLHQAEGELDAAASEATEEELRGVLARTEAELASAAAALAEEKSASQELEERRKRAWLRLREIQSREAVLSELSGRFHLLDSQYASDLRRLESIAEAGLRLDQMKETKCPVCGADAEHHVKHDPAHRVAPGAVVEACNAEVERLRVLSADLQCTITDSTEELRRLQHEAEGMKAELHAAERELAEHYRPRVQAVLDSYREAKDRQSAIQHALEVHTRLGELRNMLEGLDGQAHSATKSEFAAVPGSMDSEQLALKIEQVLRDWQFPGLQRVTFSDADQDILVSGRKRSEHGKGVRAVTHAAFTIGLMHYCVDKAMPHPGVVVLDSPLVVYREPDPDEAAFAPQLKNLVYKTLADDVDRGQIIILENEDPPADLSKSATVVRFTGSAHGRQGFIPARMPLESH